MTARLCKYGCGILLEGFDEEARKYLESGTGGLHTKERCQEAKAKLEQKNDHGNEAISPKEYVERLGYVDHTQVAKEGWKHKTITDPTPEGFDLKINNFGKEHEIRASQFQIASGGVLYTISIWYSEEGKTSFKDHVTGNTS